MRTGNAGTVELVGRRALVRPYPKMAIDDLIVLKSAGMKYACALRRFGLTDYKTWAYLIIARFSRPQSMTHNFTTRDRVEAEAIAAQLIAVQTKYEGATHV